MEVSEFFKVIVGRQSWETRRQRQNIWRSDIYKVALFGQNKKKKKTQLEIGKSLRPRQDFYPDLGVLPLQKDALRLGLKRRPILKMIS